MILFLLLFVTLFLAVYLGKTDWENPSIRNCSSILLGIIFVIMFFLTIGFTCQNTIDSIDNYENYKIMNEKISIYENLHKEKIDIIQSLLKVYPIEGEMYKGMNLSILLKVPEIKSNKLLQNDIKIAIDSRNKISQMKVETINLKKEIRKVSNYWFLVPSLYYPPIGCVEE